MRLKKIKNLKDGISIDWEVKNKEGKWIPYSMEKNTDKADQEFYDCLDALKPYLIEICEVTPLPEELIVCTGVSLSYKGEFEEMHVCIHGYRTYERSNGADNFNSPKKAAEDFTGTDAEDNVLNGDCFEIVKSFVDQAKMYIKGEQKQTELNLKKEEKENDPDRFKAKVSKPEEETEPA